MEKALEKKKNKKKVLKIPFILNKIFLYEDDILPLFSTKKNNIMLIFENNIDKKIMMNILYISFIKDILEWNKKKVYHKK